MDEAEKYIACLYDKWKQAADAAKPFPYGHDDLHDAELQAFNRLSEQIIAGGWDGSRYDPEVNP